MNRTKKLAYNTVFSLIFQITSIFCGFILPRFILKYFGSDVNGLVNSISQFLGIISFLELGMGAVVQSSLYKPLTEKNNELISKIYASAYKFFRKLALILLVYIIVLCAAYPFIKRQFGWVYTAALIAAMSISLFSQYYFGIVDRLLLTADQKGFIQYTSQTLTLVLNTVACVVLIKLGAGIHIVKLTTSVIFLFRPLFLHWYVKKHYVIDRKIKYDEEPIRQKWNGAAQHLSAVVLDGTDQIVLTLFASFADVSVYSVYHLVIYGVKNLFMSMTNGIQALIGELWAKQDREALNSTFRYTEWLIHTGTVFIFGCTAVLVLPFVKVYTLGIEDADYAQPLFAFLITAAHAGHCLRLPYSIMILAAGHYKQTQRCYIIASFLNIALSIAAVKWFGLIGVAIGTLAAMLYQTVRMAVYCSKNLLNRPVSAFLKQLITDVVIFAAVYFVSFRLTMGNTDYFSWTVLAVKVCIISAIITAAVNFVLYRKNMLGVFSSVVKKIKKT